MNELKPCPFCGGEADTAYNTQFNFQVFCTNDECFMNFITMYDMATEEEAIEAWNRRANEDSGTVDVVERKKGKWIKKMRIIETDKYASFTPEWYCSCCGEGYAPYIAELISFCPNCGADMREEKNRWMM